MSWKQFADLVRSLQVEESLDEAGTRHFNVSLESLWVERPVPYTVGERTFTASLTADGSLHISAPNRLFHRGKARYRLGPDRYQWLGGVPSPRRYAAPEPLRRHPSRGSRPHSAPFLEAIRWVAYANCCPKSDTIDAAATSVWRALWKRIGPHLHSEALELAALHDLAWDDYVSLSQHGHLRRLLRSAPGVGGGFCAVALDTPRRDVIAAWMAHLHRAAWGDHGRDPGFQAWAGVVPVHNDAMPDFPKLREYDASHRAQLAWAVSRLAQEGLVDPQGVRRIDSNGAWRLFHSLALQVERSKNVGLFVMLMLRQPEQALKAVLSRHSDMDPRMAINAFVADALQYMAVRQDAETPASSLRRGLGQLPELRRIGGWGRLLREMDRCKRLSSNAAEFSSSRTIIAWGEGALFSHYPTGLLKRHVLSGSAHAATSLPWVVANAGLRLDMEVRSHLMRHKSLLNTRALLKLVGDRTPEDYVAWWGVLAEQSPEDAVRVLEEEAPPPGAGFVAATLAPLFGAKGAVSVRAFALLHRLAQAA
jgi:hypothetical protein